MFFIVKSWKLKQVGIQVLRQICLIDNLADVINKITQG